jgi:competence protein ComEC
MTSLASVNSFCTLTDTFERERTRWPYWLPVAMAAGIAGYFYMPFESPLWMLAIVPVLAGLAWLVRSVSWPVAVILFVFMFAGLGFSAAQIETRLDERPMLDRDLNVMPISGRVAMTDVMPDGIRLTLSHPRIGDLPPADVPEKIRLKFNELTLDDAPPTGAEVSLTGRVGALSEPVAPGATDFRWQAYFKHLGGIGWSTGKITVEAPASGCAKASPDLFSRPAEASCEGGPPSLSWRENFSLTLESARKTLARHVYERLPAGDVAAMTAARLNGEQSAISPAVIEAMRIAGLVHLLSTSGFHVTIMALLIYFPLRMILALFPWLALRYPIKKWAAGAAIFSAMGYTFLVGSQAATLRSMIMTSVAMLAITTDRRATPLRLVMLSAGLCMILAPDAVMGPSFQMSFAAVFCLIAANPQSWDWTGGNFTDFLPEGLRSFIAHFWGIMRTSLIATAATTPFAIYHFQSFSLYGFIANMAAIPLTSFWVMPSILLAYLTAPFGYDGFFIDMAALGVAVTIRIATIVAAWPHSIFYWPAMPSFVFVAIVLGGLWLCIWREKWRYLGFLPIIIGMMYPFYAKQPDFFITPDGKEWAARLDDGRLAVSNISRNKFAVTQWQQRLGNVEMLDAKGLPPDNQQIRCDDEGCVYRKGAHIVAMPSDETATLEDCSQADIVIAPFIITDCGGKQVVDEQALHEHGAHVIYFDEDQTRLEFARNARGARPWSVGWKNQAEKAENDD